MTNWSVGDYHKTIFNYVPVGSFFLQGEEKKWILCLKIDEVKKIKNGKEANAYRFNDNKLIFIPPDAKVALPVLDISYDPFC
jgi:hypothetical protein